MSSFRVVLAVSTTAGVLLSGCGSNGPSFVAQHEPWRDNDERACLMQGAVRETPFIAARSALGGPSTCGAQRPFEMSGAMGGRVVLKPAAMLRCPMVPAIDHWVSNVIVPAAQRAFGQPVVEVKVAASYACRPMNHQSGAKLSEHGHANAFDVSQFKLADGRWVTVLAGWNGRFDERQFLREVHAGACRTFNTVLGPQADAFHRDHFHVDLARHGRDGHGKICK